jgi:hypothetical protein
LPILNYPPKLSTGVDIYKFVCSPVTNIFVGLTIT